MEKIRQHISIHRINNENVNDRNKNHEDDDIMNDRQSNREYQSMIDRTMENIIKALRENNIKSFVSECIKLGQYFQKKFPGIVLDEIQKKYQPDSNYLDVDLPPLKLLGALTEAKIRAYGIIAENGSKEDILIMDALSKGIAMFGTLIGEQRVQEALQEIENKYDELITEDSISEGERNIHNALASIKANHIRDILNSQFPTANNPIEITPVKPVSEENTIPLDLDTIAYNINEIHTKIASLIQSNFTHTAIINDKKVLIQYQEESNLSDDPTNQHEAEIQAWRHYKAMLLFADSDPDKKEKRIKEINEIFSTRINTHPITADNTKELATEFAKLILKETYPTPKSEKEYNKSLKKAMWDLTRARDIGILMEDHPDIITITKNDNGFHFEHSENAKIPNNAYSDQKKFNPEPDNDEHWLNSVMSKNFDVIKEKKVPAPPSARWLPLAGNVQDMQQTHYTHKESGLNKTTSLTLMRIGTLSSFLRKPPGVTKLPIFAITKKQKETIKKVNDTANTSATENLRQIMTEDKLKHATEKAREIYGFLGEKYPPIVYIDYVNILSPLKLPFGEANYGHLDNNTRFVNSSRHAINALNKEAEETNSDIRYLYSNSAINKVASLAQTYPADNDTREKKIETVINLIHAILGENDTTTKNLITYLNQPDQSIDNTEEIIQIIIESARKQKASQEAINEITSRIQAAVQLRALMNSEAPYSQMHTYQRNLMQASLEIITLGNEALHLVGCKSARDRTAILMAAVETMQKNPDAMKDWTILNDGVIQGLKEGHHTRSMSYHVAAVKVSDVHKSFIQQLPDAMQKSIKSFKVFSKSLETSKQNNDAYQKLRDAALKPTIGNINSVLSNSIDKMQGYPGFKKIVDALQQNDFDSAKKYAALAIAKRMGSKVYKRITGTLTGDKINDPKAEWMLSFAKLTKNHIEINTQNSLQTLESHIGKLDLVIKQSEALNEAIKFKHDYLRLSPSPSSTVDPTLQFLDKLIKNLSTLTLPDTNANASLFSTMKSAYNGSWKFNLDDTRVTGFDSMSQHDDDPSTGIDKFIETLTAFKNHTLEALNRHEYSAKF